MSPVLTASIWVSLPDKRHTWKALLNGQPKVSGLKEVFSLACKSWYDLRNRMSQNTGCIHQNKSKIFCLDLGQLASMILRFSNKILRTNVSPFCLCPWSMLRHLKRVPWQGKGSYLTLTKDKGLWQDVWSKSVEELSAGICKLNSLNSWKGNSEVTMEVRQHRPLHKRG